MHILWHHIQDIYLRKRIFEIFDLIFYNMFVDYKLKYG